MANYHPNDELLMQFSAGQLPNALGIMIACHLQYCPTCRHKIKLYEELGGEILALTQPVSVAEDSFQKILGRLNEPEIPRPVQTDFGATVNVPRPLRRFVPDAYDQLTWSGMTKSIREYAIRIDDPVYSAKLYRIAAGKELPEHTHRGNEYTLVMEGSFSDKAGDYKPGDFVLADTHTVHQPRASMERDCICFAVQDAPLKMTGFFGRMLNPFLR